MPEQMHYLPVNWVDGMLISKSHLEATGLYTESIARDAASVGLNSFNYGLLAGGRSLELNVSADFNQQIQVTLTACEAITPAGFRISLEGTGPLTATGNFKEIVTRYKLATGASQQLLVLLTVNPFRRIPTGELLEPDNPPRHPYTRPEMRIDIVPAESIVPAQFSAGIIIGRVDYQNGELQVRKDFIPPCTRPSSLPALQTRLHSFREMLENWEQYCVRIIQKINGRTPSAQPNVLATSILHFSEKVLEQLVRQKIRFQWTLSQEAPVYFCAALVENIYIAQAALLHYSEKDREEMLNYFAEWTDTAPGALEKQTAQLFGLRYDHNDIAGVLAVIQENYQAWINLFLKLSQLDFIGKKKGQNIFVIEQEVKPVNPPTPPKQNSRWSPLT